MTSLRPSPRQSVATPVPTQPLIVSGNGQSGRVNTALANPLVVRVADHFGNGVGGRQVNFSSLTGGTVNPPMVITDGDGLAQTTGILGPAFIPQGFRATSGPLPPVTFIVTAFP